MEAAVYRCGAAYGPLDRPQRARSLVMELQPLRGSPSDPTQWAEYSGVSTISELNMPRSPGPYSWFQLLFHLDVTMFTF
jgi:hypothetical protein